MIEFIDVKCLMTKERKILPFSFCFKDHWYDISKVTEIVKMASTKGGGKGTRFSCKIGDKIHHLFFDENVWWVELK